ncbi:response regulator [Microbacterium sp. nov. GSS16]|uniref:response regulator n=1 Tax=Microbacterium sp. nov. GSS16 TaxID=3019890 RepID=UPI00230525E9|nr:response regulator transcription factor [Microbacterium sp. nov. GSS16]WCD93624.1 response regulator transcription factor [Microbacterium sp. nov. GSS16]
MIRVLLVDDHAMLRAGFRAILGTQPDIEVVGEAGTGIEGVRLAADLLPDVIMMDVQMPDMDGIRATRLIVADPRVTASVAIVTTFDRDEYLFQALDAGAGGFLLKNAGPEELITAVRALAAGDGILAPEVTRRVLSRFAVSGSGASAGSAAQGGAATRAGGAPAGSAAEKVNSATPGILAEPLTDREAEVLVLMADARSNAEIAGELFIGEATVKTHVSRVLQKIGARDRVQAIVLAHRHGLTR